MIKCNNNNDNVTKVTVASSLEESSSLKSSINVSFYWKQTATSEGYSNSTIVPPSTRYDMKEEPPPIEYINNNTQWLLIRYILPYPSLSPHLQYTYIINLPLWCQMSMSESVSKPVNVTVKITWLNVSLKRTFTIKITVKVITPCQCQTSMSTSMSDCAISRNLSNYVAISHNLSNLT